MSHRILQGKGLIRTVGANDEVIDTTFTDREGNETLERYYHVTEKEAADIEDFENLESRKVWVHRTDSVTTFVCKEPEDSAGLSVEYQVLNTIKMLGTGVHVVAADTTGVVAAAAGDAADAVAAVVIERCYWVQQTC